MCGICGIATQKQIPIDVERLKRMNNALIHRGPDSEGFYQEPGIGLAMRRLKVIDLSTGDQPMTNEDRTIWVVFNGEIYNFHLLREQLINQGHQFRSHSDTECIVHLYEQYGVSFLKYLRGMFAIALWDANKKRLFLARDRFGKKPLYYFEKNGKLIFSSELNSLLQGMDEKPAIDLSAINLYLSLQYIPDPLTAYQGIHSLPPAHFLTWQNNALLLEKYWDLEYTPKLQGNRNDLKEELKEKVGESIKLRMISDVPLGAHLSGGIDSSIIVSQMAKWSTSPVKTFSVGFEESSFSELPFARAVAQRYAADHQEFILDWGNIPETLTEIIKFVGQPLADPSLIPLFHLSRLTRQYVTVALNGDGGDECFAGYARYWLDPFANIYQRIPKLFTNRLFPAIFNLFPDNSDRPSGSSLINGLKRLKEMVGIDPRASILRWGSYFSPHLLQELWNRPLLAELNPNHAEEWLIQRFGSAHADSFLDRTLSTDMQTYLPGDLMVKADRMSMAHSLESRSPFLDHELTEWAARLPGQYKINGLTGKVLLRETFKEILPDEINRRGKQGFGIPISAWCRGPLSSWLQQTLIHAQEPFKSWFDLSVINRLIDEHQKGKVDHGKRLWALAVLSAWTATQ
jgi:asparagine synthase (glutamine-hydrolysing)